jgi:hypothetical protein
MSLVIRDIFLITHNCIRLRTKLVEQDKMPDVDPPLAFERGMKGLG